MKVQNVSISTGGEEGLASFPLASFLYHHSIVLVLHPPILSIGLQGRETGNGQLTKSNMEQRSKMAEE